MAYKRRCEFVTLKSCNKPKKKQAWIYYTCCTYDDQPKTIREKIDRLCRDVGGEYAEALRDALLHADSKKIDNCSPSTLWRVRLEFFNKW